VVKDFPEFPVVNEYGDLRKLLANHLELSLN
jgi:hypothetical protein